MAAVLLGLPKVLGAGSELCTITMTTSSGIVPRLLPAAPVDLTADLVLSGVLLSRSPVSIQLILTLALLSLFPNTRSPSLSTVGEGISSSSSLTASNTLSLSVSSGFLGDSLSAL